MKTNLLNFLLACPITFMCILLFGCSGNANTINQSETVKPTTITPSENNVVNNTANNIANKCSDYRF